MQLQLANQLADPLPVLQVNLQSAPGKVEIVPTGGNPATVITPDIVAGAAIVHIVDTVLLPNIPAVAAAYAANAGRAAAALGTPATVKAPAAGPAAAKTAAAVPAAAATMATAGRR